MDNSLDRSQVETFLKSCGLDFWEIVSFSKESLHSNFECLRTDVLVRILRLHLDALMVKFDEHFNTGGMSSTVAVTN